MDQVDRECQVERHRKYEEERAEQEKRFAEEQDREFREREPFEHFAEFLLKVEPLHGSTGYTADYQLIIRHLKNCKLTKLATAIEKMAAERRDEEEQMSA